MDIDKIQQKAEEMRILNLGMEKSGGTSILPAKVLPVLRWEWPVRKGFFPWMKSCVKHLRKKCRIILLLFYAWQQ